MKIRKLNKCVLSVTNNAQQFLNGLTANSLDQPRNAFLNLHGKIIVTFDQIEIADDHFFIVIEESSVGDLFAHIDRYIKLSKTQVERVDYHVYFDLDGGYTLKEDEYTIAQRQGQLVITKKELTENISNEEFILFRLKNTIPVQGIDYNNDFLLNVSEDEFVSYTKGCYLGQEPVSKVHSRSKPTWKLVVKYEDECSEEELQKMTSKAVDSGRTLGFTMVKNT